MCCPVCECDLKKLNEEEQAEHVESHFVGEYISYYYGLINCMHALINVVLCLNYYPDFVSRKYIILLQ